MMLLDSFIIFLLVSKRYCMITTYYATDAYVPSTNFAYNSVRHRLEPVSTFLSVVPRYGPTSSDSSNTNDIIKSSEGESQLSSSNNNTKIKEKFRNLVEQVMQISQPEHIPRLLVNNIELIMGLQGEDGIQVISSLLDDAKQKTKNDVTSIKNGGDNDVDGNNSSINNTNYYTQTIQTVEMILTFAEDFVKQAQEMDSNNKNLLGKIMKAMVKSDSDTSITGGERRKDSNNQEASSVCSREEALDNVMKEEKKKFTTGFLRHIEGECNRIANAQKITTESTRLLEILRLIQTRVLEELGHDLGEAALVLGQLMGYEKESELSGVLDAGLKVQGRDFALEMASLTGEALGGFKRVPGGADPELIEKVTFIDKRLQDFLNETNEFQ